MLIGGTEKTIPLIIQNNPTIPIKTLSININQHQSTSINYSYPVRGLQHAFLSDGVFGTLARQLGDHVEDVHGIPWENHGESPKKTRKN